MNDQTQSSAPFDFGKLMADFDPTKMMEQFNNAIAGYKLPGLDVKEIMDANRKNVDALATANKQAVEGVKSIVSRQGEILRETLDEAAKALKDLTSTGNPSEAASKQADLLKQAFEKALANMRELAEMATKSNTEVFQTINGRMQESMAEIKELTAKLKK